MKSLIYYISEKIHFPNVKSRVTEELYKILPKTIMTTFILASIFLYLFINQINNNIVIIIWYILFLILNSSWFYDYIQYTKRAKIKSKTINNCTFPFIF